MTSHFDLLTLEDIEPDYEQNSYQCLLALREQNRSVGFDLSVLKFPDKTLAAISHPLGDTNFPDARVSEVYANATLMQWLNDNPAMGNAS